MGGGGPGSVILYLGLPAGGGGQVGGPGMVSSSGVAWPMVRCPNGVRWMVPGAGGVFGGMPCGGGGGGSFGGGGTGGGLTHAGRALAG